MFKISNDIILRKSTPLVFNRGKEYYRSQKVKSISFIQDRLLFDAVVLGSKKYNVQIQFNSSGELYHTDCTCPAHDDYWGMCKHIVAVLLALKDKQEQGVFDGLKSKQVSKRIFSYFQNIPSAVKIPVNLEIEYNFNRAGYYGDSTYSTLSFRIGMDKLYILKSVKKFFESIENGNPVEFGKNFTFDPMVHCFKEQDQPVIYIIKELYETEKLMEDLPYGYTGRGSSLFKDKEVMLPSNAVKRFFRCMEGRAFKAEILGRTFDRIEIRNEDFPLEFGVKQQENGLVLDIGYEEPLVPLTDEGEYFMSGNTIYRTSMNRQESFKPFYIAMLQQKGNSIHFYTEDMERFVSEILPFAEKAGNVEIDENLQSMIEKIDLDAEIYLDRGEGEDGGISADVKFVYNESIINPFAPQDKERRPRNTILVRDVERERFILDVLGESDFKVRNNKIILYDEDEIFNFVFETIPKLQEYCRIFYSEGFRKTVIRQPSAFSGGVRLNSGSGMLEISFNIDGIDRSELPDIFKSLKENKKYYRLKNGAILPLNSGELRGIANIADYLDIGKKEFDKGFIEVPQYRALYIDQHLKDSGLRYFERNQAFKEFVRNITDPEDIDMSIPSTLNGTLREYQKFGFKWMKTMASYGLGAILADDMGLGKTLQVITLLLSDKYEKGTLPSLIIVPTSLVYNWQAEIERFAPELKTAVISGNKEERLNLLETIQEYDAVITSYPLIRRDSEDYGGFEFRYCILDEAQHIKNAGSQNAKSVKAVKAKNRLALTGTPMENSLDELWSIFDFILPGYLFSHVRFTEKYAKPIVKNDDKKALEELGRHIRPFILRRLKTEVLKELPEKIEHKMVSELTARQKKVYLAYLQKVRNEIEKDIEERGFERSQIKILSALTRLRQICCHPALFLDGFEGESGKMLLLQEIIEDALEGGHRILLFSQFTSMLKIIQEWLKSRNTGHLYLDGDTKMEERARLVKSFNNGHGDVFLISLKAGGTGLNLTGADTVIHYDPWWNPAVEDQATDRAYRIGQQKSVHVMKLITRGTIEEKIYNLQENKKRLIDAVIQPGETLLSKMSEKEVRELFE